MTNKILGTGKRCKDTKNLKGYFEQVPSTLFNYLKLGLITHNDYTVYIYLLKNENGKYAFPSVNKIALETGMSPSSVKTSTKRLESVGLIRKGKSTNYINKNIYFVDLPLSENELFSQVPELVKKYELKKAEMEKEQVQDQIRLTTHIENKNV